MYKLSQYCNDIGLDTTILTKLLNADSQTKKLKCVINNADKLNNKYSQVFGATAITMQRSKLNSWYIRRQRTSMATCGSARHCRGDAAIGPNATRTWQASRRHLTKPFCSRQCTRHYLKTTNHNTLLYFYTTNAAKILHDRKPKYTFASFAKDKNTDKTLYVYIN